MSLYDECMAIKDRINAMNDEQREIMIEEIAHALVVIFKAKQNGIAEQYKKSIKVKD